MKCAQCEDCGRVCEDHPDRPWGGSHACSGGGVGAPCPACNVPHEGAAARMPTGFKTEVAKDGWRP